MKKLLILCFAGCMAACCTTTSAVARGAAKPASTRIMTCNIRVTGLPADSVGGRSWEDRRDVCVRVIRSRKPDLICMQEVVYDSYAYLKDKFSEYVAFGFSGPEMDPYTEGYHFIAKNVIFFRKDRYELTGSGCYWLSETPLIAGSCSWNTMRARHCNWVRLRDKKTGREFRLLDVHLDHKSDDARREQMKMIVAEAAQYLADFPQIVCGDFNAGIGHAAVKCLREAGWNEMYEGVHGPAETGYTCHVFEGENRAGKGRRIDFIFARGGVEPVSAEIVRDRIGGIYPSDHYFLSAELLIP